MIASLRGILAHKSPRNLIVDVGGVGYEVFFSPGGLHRLPETGEEIFLHIFTNVREDAIDLYGFLDPGEKEMFVLLTSVSGIGPKVAVNILAGMAPADLAGAISGTDLGRLTKLQGVGKKTAERMCLELKDKVHFMAATDSVVLGVPDLAPDDRQSADVISALVNLGYPPANARKALEKVRSGAGEEGFGKLSLEDLLRQALRSMA
ncbi:MAG: Holliday junction branch migration protein RuvA [Desulfurivibrionaceae bacterium]|nr:Holliday junction branch migration protein RuvA [Desulfobulbales bacterium]MDT8334640.1 Holliday junction branch migration protein RuvA [Desulfurivibrionaceae bacterium]